MGSAKNLGISEQRLGISGSPRTSTTPYQPQRTSQYIGCFAMHEGMKAMNDAIRTTQHGTAYALLRLPAVLALVGVSKATLYRWANAGMFPRPHALTPTRSTVAWSSTEVHAWIAGKLAANDGTFDGTSEDEAAKAA